MQGFRQKMSVDHWWWLSNQEDCPNCNSSRAVRETSEYPKSKPWLNTERKTVACNKLKLDVSIGTLGAISELRVAADLMTRPGVSVFRALSPNSPCDLVLMKDANYLVRVEVTTGRYGENGKIYCTDKRPGYRAKYSLLAIVLPDRIVYKGNSGIFGIHSNITTPTICEEVLGYECVWNCDLIQGKHEVGCPHKNWTIEELRIALITKKNLQEVIKSEVSDLTPIQLLPTQNKKQLLARIKELEIELKKFNNSSELIQQPKQTRTRIVTTSDLIAKRRAKRERKRIRRAIQQLEDSNPAPLEQWTREQLAERISLLEELDKKSA